jgi:hypothetical protein
MSWVEEDDTRREGSVRQRRVGKPAKCSVRPGNQQEDRDTDQKEHTPGYEQEHCTTMWRHAVSVTPGVRRRQTERPAATECVCSRARRPRYWGWSKLNVTELLNASVSVSSSTSIGAAPVGHTRRAR